VTQPVHVGTLNEHARGTVDRALAYEQQLAAVYAGQLRRAARYAARRFRELAPVQMAAVTAAVNPTPPDWTPPDHDELQTEPLDARAQKQARKIHLAAVAAAVPEVLKGRLDELGIAYDVASPFAQPLLEKVGTKGVNLGIATRDVIVKVIGQAYQEGWTVPQTAAALQEEIDHLSTTTATMQARTDLVGLANGSSVAAVQALGENAPAVKVWLTAGDERVRDTHADADGQEVPVDQPFQVGDDFLAYPGDPSGSDAETINCRCVVTYGDTETPSAGEVDELAIAASAEPSPSSAPPEPGVASGAVSTSPESLAAAVTITVDDDEQAEEEMAVETPWQAILCVEGEQTEDGRLLDPGSITWRETPLSLGAMFETPHSFDVAAPIVGRIDLIYRDATDPRIIRGEGIFNSDEAGCKAVEMIGNESLRGISVDLMVKAYDLRPADPPIATDEVPDDGDGDEDYPEAVTEMDNTIMAVTDGVIGGATVCPVQAIANATIAIVASAGGSIEVAHGKVGDRFVRVHPNRESFGDIDGTLVASAGPAVPPRAWFDLAETPGPCPLTVTDEGRVFGHVALWDSCHTGFGDQCVRPPRSPSNYSYFHVGELITDSGEKLAIGKLMFGGRHASLGASRAEAAKHYDDNTYVGAYVKAFNGRHGIWVSGSLREGLDDAQLAEIRANPPSGDWRRANGALELIAALAVPVPGFPVPRAEAGMVASGDVVEVCSLIASAGEIELTPQVTRALERAGVLERSDPAPSEPVARARIRAKAARALGRDELVAAALGDDA
jgi:hypothetical protein